LKRHASDVGVGGPEVGAGILRIGDLHERELDKPVLASEVERVGALREPRFGCGPGRCCAGSWAANCLRQYLCSGKPRFPVARHSAQAPGWGRILRCRRLGSHPRPDRGRKLR
jgi:hypothetical protein